MHASSPRVLVPLLVVACLGAAALHGCRARPQVTTLVGPTMGGRYAVTIGAVLSSEARAEAAAAVERELARVDALMSNWRADSEVERLNRSRVTSPIAVSRELAEVVAIAGHVSDLSAGAFDVTVGPVVRAWGFGSSRPIRCGACAIGCSPPPDCSARSSCSATSTRGSLAPRGARRRT